MDGFTLLWLELKNYAQLTIEHMQETNKNRIPSYQLQSGYLHQLVNNVSSTLYLWTNFVPTQNRVNRNSYFAPQKTHPMCDVFFEIIASHVRNSTGKCASKFAQRVN